MNGLAPVQVCSTFSHESNSPQDLGSSGQSPCGFESRLSHLGLRFRDFTIRVL